MNSVSEEKVLAFRKSEIDDLVDASKSDLEKIISIMRDHLNGVIPVSEEVFFLLCETVSGINLINKIIVKLIDPKNEIKKGYYGVSKDIALLLSSNLTLLKASKLSLTDYGMSLEEM